MKWGLRIFGIADILTFLILVPSKFNFLLTTFSLPFSAAQKTSAIWDLLVLSLFLDTGLLLFKYPRTGLLLSFILILFRITYLFYFSFDFLSYIAYYTSFEAFISSASFQHNWFYILIGLEIFRYGFSFYWYSKLTRV